MKYIVKGEEPQSFINWKNSDKMYKRGKPNWDRFNHSQNKTIKDELLEALKKDQGYICCYCERELKDNDYHPEHIKPKNKNSFPELQLEYSNLLCSCQLNIEKGTPEHCGKSKADNIILITPLDSDCETKFTYTEDGYIDFTDDASQTTIEHLNLHSDKLNVLRNKAIEPFIIDLETFEAIPEDDAKQFAVEYLKKKDGKYNEFYTTIKYLFG